MEKRAGIFETIHKHWGYYVPTYVAGILLIVVAQISESFPEHTSLATNGALALIIGLPASLLIQMPWFRGEVKLGAALAWTIFFPFVLFLTVGFLTEWLL
jgi:hypothetical protein